MIVKLSAVCAHGILLRRQRLSPGEAHRNLTASTPGRSADLGSGSDYHLRLDPKAAPRHVTVTNGHRRRRCERDPAAAHRSRPETDCTAESGSDEHAPSDLGPELQIQPADTLVEVGIFDGRGL